MQSPIAILDQYQTLIKQLFQAIQDEDAIKISDLSQKLMLVDDNLNAEIRKVENHQKSQEKIQKLEAQVSRNDQVLEEIVRKLKDAESKLTSAISIGKQRLKAIEDSEKNAMKPQEIISYARKISYTTSAPPNWTPEAPLLSFLPPTPQDEDLRSGGLYVRPTHSWLTHLETMNAQKQQ